MKLKLTFFLAFLICFCGCSKDLDDVILPPSIKEILGQAEVTASASNYSETEYIIGDRNSSYYYDWKVSSGKILTDQGRVTVWIKLIAPRPGTYTDVAVKVDVYDKYPNGKLQETLEKIIKVK